MGRLSSILRSTGPNRVSFWCPGCDEAHVVRVEGAGAWGYNGNPDAPTFTPSIKVTGVEFTPAGLALFEKDQADGTRRGDGFTYPNVATCCHSVVTEGSIHFLSDCTHSLAGIVVPLPEWPAREEQTDG